MDETRNDMFKLSARSGARLGFIAVVATFVVLGLVQSITPVISFSPLAEFRKPAPAPDVVALLQGKGRIAPEVHAWFDDRMGFRAPLTRLANQIDYSIFGFSKTVYVGKEGWLYLKTGLTQVVDHARLNDNRMAEEKLNAVASYLQRRNIKLIVIGTPNKEAIYPEFLPYGTPRLPLISQFQKFREFLKRGDGARWTYIDAHDLYRAAKPGSPVSLFYKTDIHATTYATLILAKAMFSRLAKIENIDWTWRPAFTFAPYRKPDGTELRFMSVFSDLTETIDEPTYLHSVNFPPPGGVFEIPPRRPFEYIFHNKTGSVPFPSAVFFGSSFLDRFLALGVHASFSDVYRVRGLGHEIGNALRAIPPGTRYFIYELWEPHFWLVGLADIPSE